MTRQGYGFVNVYDGSPDVFIPPDAVGMFASVLSNLTVVDVGDGIHYLQEDHTLAHFREVRYSELFDRDVYDQWKEAGARPFEERLRVLTREAMQHEPARLDAAIVKELDRMQAHWE